MTITGSLLATITLQHDYYADARTRDFGIVPSVATAAQLLGLGIRWKMVDNVLLLIIKLDEDGKPNIPLPADARFSFYLTLERPSAAAFTATPQGLENGESVFYLTNATGNIVDGVAYLHPVPPPYAAAKMYAAGDLARNGSGDVFAAIKEGKGHNTGDASYWQAQPGKSYANTDAATMPLLDGLVNVEVPAAALMLESIVYAFNAVTRAYDIQVDTQQSVFETPQTAASLDLRSLPPGPYRIVTNGGEAFVYIDAAASYSRVWGIIELVTSFTGTPFALLDADGKPRGLDHVVRFASRMVKWKYNLRAEAGFKIADSAGLIAFQKVMAQPAYISQKPLPMRDTPVKTIQLIKTEDGHDNVIRDHLQNPSPLILSTFDDGSGTLQTCIEAFLAN